MSELTTIEGWCKLRLLRISDRKIEEDQPIRKRNARFPKQKAEGQGVEKDPAAALLSCESAKFCLRERVAFSIGERATDREGALFRRMTNPSGRRLPQRLSQRPYPAASK